MNLAVIYNPVPDTPGFAGYMCAALAGLCDVTHYKPGQEQAGHDWYLYIDDGPSYYMEPAYHPAAYLAMDMVVKPYWYLQPVEDYYKRLQNFDKGFVTSTASLAYCQERGYDAKLIGFACDPKHHRWLDFTRDLDWIAVWHNCEGRVEASNRAYERFPGGRVAWVGGDLYAAYISRARCALNWLRGDIVNMRVFEVAACLTPLVTTRHPDMATWGWVEDEHYRGYDEDDIDGMLDQIAWCNDNPVAAEQMAIRARQHVYNGHTYLDRAREILEYLR